MEEINNLTKIENVEKTNVEKYMDNLNSNEYKEYLNNFKKIIEDKNKCVKNKKCNSFLIYSENNLIYEKKNEKKKLEMPKYINIPQRLSEIKKEIDEYDIKIRSFQKIINSESNKKDIEEYRNIRDNFIKLEKENNEIEEYCDKINNTQNKKRKNDILNLINMLNKKKILIYQQLQILYKMKNSPKFDNDEYEKKIKEYLDNSEIKKLKKELDTLDGFVLKSDIILGNSNKNYNIEFIVESLPKKTKKKLKLVKTKKL